MRSMIAIFTTALLAISTALPISGSESASSIMTPEYLPVVSRIEPPVPTPGTVLTMPPPLFDPPEPRPDPLFDSSSKAVTSVSGSNLRAPPIPESRTETLLPFDGAHVHPFATPYTPESLPGTCAHSMKCSVLRTSAEIGGSLLLLVTTIYAIVYICDKLIRRMFWSAKSRARSPSGSLRLEPEPGNKLAESQQFVNSDTKKPPVVKVWCEKGLEKAVFV